METLKNTRKSQFGARLSATIMMTLVWISNHRSNKVWGETTYPFPNFNVSTVEVFLMDD